MKTMLQKSIFSIAVVLLASASIYAQVPQGFNFQAVARDANGDILANTQLGVQISLLEGSEDGNPLYTETHSVTTNPLGLIQIVIGEGTAAEEQDFSKIDFGAGNVFVKLAIDPEGGTEYADLGTTRLLSVPYAMVAQKAIEGGGSLNGTEINLNTTDADSSFIINLEGDKQAKPFQVFSKSTSDNRAIYGEAFSEESNEGAQRGVLGFANGSGTGSHMGVFGGAVNFDATGSSRRGVYGQAASKAKFNYGVFGIAAGDGNGETETNPEEGDFGSFNLGGYFQAYGNLNGNTGAQGVSAGENGNLRNFGLIGTARTTASGINVGVRGEAFNSTTENIAFGGSAFGSTKNIGMVLDVNGGTSNTGMIVNADTAAILNGHSIINGDLTVNGTINGGNSEPQNFIDIKNSSELTVASMYAEGENNELGGGLFLSGPNSANLRFGGQTWNNADLPYMQLFGTTSDGNGFYKDNIFVGVNSNGTDESGAIYLKRTNISTTDSEQTVEIDGGAGNMVLAGNVNAAGGFSSNNRVNVLGNLNDSGAGGIEVLDASGALRIYADGGNGTLSVNRASDNGGVVTLSEDGSGNGRLSMVNSNNNEALNFDAGSNTFQFKDGSGNTTINFDAAFGNAVFNGTVTESSDLRLKTNVTTLTSALDKTVALRGVSYNWKDADKSQDTQIGVIAQEVEEIYPEFVRTDAEGMKSVNYSQMVAVLIEAVKELNAEIEELKSDNATLQAKLEVQEKLEQRMAKIEELLQMQSYSMDEEHTKTKD